MTQEQSPPTPSYLPQNFNQGRPLSDLTPMVVESELRRMHDTLDPTSREALECAAQTAELVKGFASVARLEALRTGEEPQHISLARIYDRAQKMYTDLTQTVTQPLAGTERSAVTTRAWDAICGVMTVLNNPSLLKGDREALALAWRDTKIESLQLRAKPQPPIPVTPEAAPVIQAAAKTPEHAMQAGASRVVGVGATEYQGRRAAMEDVSVVFENFGGKPDRALFAVYDGHGGRAVADAASEDVSLYLLEELDRNKVAPLAALRAAYQRTDERLRQEQFPGGATAVTMLIDGDRAYVAGLGDARVVLVHKGGQAERLSKDRKVSDPEEQKAVVEQRDGTITRDMGGHPVLRTPLDKDGRYKTLAVSAALGDFNFPGVGKEPDLRAVELLSDDEWVVLGCDGLWDVISDNEISALIGGETDPRRASDILVQTANARGNGHDNYSAVVVRLGKSAQSSQAAVPRPPTPIASAVHVSTSAGPARAVVPVPGVPSAPPHQPTGNVVTALVTALRGRNKLGPPPPTRQVSEKEWQAYLESLKQGERDAADEQLDALRQSPTGPSPSLKQTMTEAERARYRQELAQAVAEAELLVGEMPSTFSLYEAAARRRGVERASVTRAQALGEAVDEWMEQAEAALQAKRLPEYHQHIAAAEELLRSAAKAGIRIEPLRRYLPRAA